MGTFDVKITETVSYLVSVDGETESEAIENTMLGEFDQIGITEHISFDDFEVVKG